MSILDVSDWPKEGKWAPRADLVPGNNAGILTTPYLLWITDGPRDRMRVYFDILWRKSPTSMNVSTQAMLSLGGHGNLRNGEGWEKISKMQYCTSCHARLDYGMQFFTAFPGVVYARSLVPTRARAGRGDFFAEDIHDRRGDNELTPRGFAELAVAQKEFADAMILDVTDYVFNQRATEDDRRAVRSAFTEVGTLKAMLRVALLRFAKSLPRDEELPALADAPPTYAPDGDVTLGAKLREKIDAYCSDCHEAGGTAGLDLSTTTLPAARLQRMLTQVAFADMPKRRSMPAAERTAMVAQLVEQLWVEDGARKVALQYFVGMERALPTEDMALVLELIRSRSSAPGQADDTPSEDKHPPLTEEGLSPVVAQYTPGLAATTALRGLEACKKRGWNGAELDQCLSRTTDPRLFIQGASPPRTAP